MPWVKLDDNFFSHPKVVAAGTEAVGLYVMALTYSAHHLTDGHVPLGWVREKAGSKMRKLVAALLAAPPGFDHALWEEHEAGWVIHDYLEYNPPREHVERERADLSAKRSDAGKKGAEARWGARQAA